MIVTRSFATPLGTIEIDQPYVEKALALPQVQILNEAHQYEHRLGTDAQDESRIAADILVAPDKRVSLHDRIVLSQCDTTHRQPTAS